MTRDPDGIRNLFAENSQAVASKLLMLDTNELRNRLADRWEKAQEKIVAMFEKAIDQELGQAGVYYRLRDNSFVILFAGNDLAAARLACERITQSVSRRLFGEECGAVRVRELIAHMDSSLISDDICVFDAVDSFLETEGEEQILHGAPAEQKEKPREDITDPSIEFSLGGYGVVKARAADLRFHYSPVWDISKNVVLSYLCRANIEPMHCGGQCGSGFLLAKDINSQVRVDMAILKDCLANIHALDEQGRRLLVVCPMHWQTVARMRSWDQINGILSSSAELAKQNLIICLHGLEASLPHIRIVQVIPKISNATRSVFACIDLDSYAIEGYVGSSTSAVGHVVPECTGGEQAVMAKARQFCVTAEQKKVNAYAFGVGTLSLAAHFYCLGYRYLEGPAVGQSASSPAHAFTQTPFDLYRPQPSLRQ